MSTSIAAPASAQSPAATKDVRNLIMSKAFQEQIQKAMPAAMSSDVLLRVAVTTIQKTPKLLDCSRESLMQCVLECAQLGLLPDGILGQAYLVPYKQTATLQIGYRGILELARRSDQVKFVVGEGVYACDEFSITYAPKREIVHVPDLENEERGIKEKGAYLPKGFRGAYALVVYKDDTIDFEYLPLHKIERIRMSSQAGSNADAPWLNHFEEMARKTAIRALGKRLPLSADDQRHIVRDEYREAGVIEGYAPDVSVREAVEDVECEDLMTKLQWSESKKALCRRNFSSKEAMLAHLRAESAKLAPRLAEQQQQASAEPGEQPSVQASAAVITTDEDEQRQQPESAVAAQTNSKPAPRRSSLSNW